MERDSDNRQPRQERSEEEKGTGYFSRVKGRFNWSEVIFCQKLSVQRGRLFWRGRRGTPDGEAIRGGVHAAASRASERIMRKDSRPLFVVQSQGRLGTPDGEAIRGGVHGAASRACEKIRMKDF